MKSCINKIKEYKLHLDKNKVLGISYSSFSLILILFLLVVQLIFVSFPNTPWWDEAIYVGMAKFVYSFGKIGFWEYFRPPIWPIFLSFFFKIGFTIKNIHIIQALISMVFLIFTYLISEKIKPKSGVLSILLISSTLLYFGFIHVLLSVYLSLLFAIISIYLFTKQRYFLSGVLLSLSFLTRFPQGLLLLGYGLVFLVDLIIHKDNKQKVKTIKNGLITLLGFILTFVPYAIHSKIYYGGYFNPIIFGSKVAADTAKFFQEPLLFYFKVILLNNFLYIFAIIFIILYIKNKLWSDKNKTIIFVSLILFFTYFTYNSHKEARYILVAIPYLAVAASYGIMTLLDILKNMQQNLSSKYFKILKKIKVNLSSSIYNILIIILLFVTLSFMIGSSAYSNWFTPTQEEFYGYFSDDSQGLLLAANPNYIFFTEKPITFMVNWDVTLKILDDELINPDHIAFNTCEYKCLDEECREYKSQLLLELNSYPIVFNKTEPQQSIVSDDEQNGEITEECRYLIYSLN